MQRVEGSTNNFHNRLLDWQEEGTHIQKLLRDYNWEYRKKICSKCPVSKQKELNCLKIDNFKEDIQETYCKKMTKARSKKFKKIILRYMDFHPSREL
ncbi:hypothetical protein NsoK4_08250 [Nitrosopumilus sp. K4]|uniref:hypothetical protein n=1 Tax=Nitrosopumilus sp. K4 TaxID=2795383 RepID=UPI001BA5E299|nr:hypothetical protein [Nitrosopumilus sp. K4]QUC64406.1 hypothetical protein NsoK4_08250 [Nitrosopumilus sp. K4]